MDVFWDNYIYNQFVVDFAQQVRERTDQDDSALLVVADSDREKHFLSSYLLRYFGQMPGFQCIDLTGGPETWKPAIHYQNGYETRTLLVMQDLDRLEDAGFRDELKTWIQEGRQLLGRVFVLLLLSQEERILLNGVSHAGLEEETIKAGKLEDAIYPSFLKFIYSRCNAQTPDISEKSRVLLYKTTWGIASRIHLVAAESVEFLKQSESTELSPEIIHYAMENISTNTLKAEEYIRPLPVIRVYSAKGFRVLLQALLGKDPLKAVLQSGQEEMHVGLILRSFINACMFFGCLIQDETTCRGLESLYTAMENNDLESALRGIFEIKTTL